MLLNFYDRRTDGRTNGQAQSNMPLQLVQSCVHKKLSDQDPHCLL